MDITEATLAPEILSQLEVLAQLEAYFSLLEECSEDPDPSPYADNLASKVLIFLPPCVGAVNIYKAFSARDIKPSEGTTPEVWGIEDVKGYISELSTQLFENEELN